MGEAEKNKEEIRMKLLEQIKIKEEEKKKQVPEEKMVKLEPAKKEEKKEEKKEDKKEDKKEEKKEEEKKEEPCNLLKDEEERRRLIQEIVNQQVTEKVENYKNELIDQIVKSSMNKLNGVDKKETVT